MRGSLRLGLRALYKPLVGPPFPIGFQRRWISLLATLNRVPRDVESATHDVEGIDVEVLRPAGVPVPKAAAVLYLHGGAYQLCGPGTHRGLTASIARATGLEVCVPDYRLAPEHPHPAALDDAFAVYRWLVDRNGDRRVAIAGDSAGGGLSLVTAVAIRGMEVAMPPALVLISPWTDLTLSGASIAAKARRDPMLRRSHLAAAAAAYTGELAAHDPGISPLFADLAHLPPILIQVGTEEILLSDSERLAERAHAAGLDVELERFDGLWHDFQVHAGALRVSDEAIAQIARFLRHHCLDDGD